jgi:hypothetical protein
MTHPAATPVLTALPYRPRLSAGKDHEPMRFTTDTIKRAHYVIVQ